jgi:hypothetical protein
MPLNDRDRRLCLHADIDPDIIDLIDADRLYTIQNLADLFKCDYKTMACAVDGIPGILIGRSRGWRVRGITFTSGIIARIRAGKPPLN